jgi:hypothetical protein
MKTPNARPNPHDRAPIDAQPLRFRAELPAVTAARPAMRTPLAVHDFLVANPRPDLIADHHTWRMIEAG